jgi:peptidoglycan/LPS O-acetylase OafA/YrhL
MEGIKEQKEYLNYINFYRGWVIVLIVSLHCAHRWLDKDGSYYLYFCAFLDHSTNLFLFISGFLYEFLLYKKYTYKTFMMKKVRRLLVPYLFWALPVCLAIFVYKGFDWEYLAFTMLTGTNHFNGAHWYIPFILLIFMMSPIYVYLDKKKVLYPLVLPFFLIITICADRQWKSPFYSELTIISLISMFFLGMLFSHYRKVILVKFYKYDWLILLLGFLVCFYQGYNHPKDPLKLLTAFREFFTNGTVIINFYAVNKVIFSVAYLFFFYRISLRFKKIAILDKLAHYSFGIYFVHFYFIHLLKWILDSHFHFQKGIPLFVLSTLLIIILSTAVIYGLRQVKYTRNIIGV